MALLFHELATNAAKYGALSLSSGKISAKWSHSDAVLQIEWRESDGPIVSRPTRSGFGTRLFLRSLEQFDGKVEAAFEPTGLVCTLRIPLTDSPASLLAGPGHPSHLATQGGSAGAC